MIFNLLYNSAILLYEMGIQLASLKNEKAKKWVEGRKHWKQKLIEAKKVLSDKVIWVHCASLGEFEQGRPVIDQLKKEYNQHKILLTFFSPSGYQVRKNYSNVDQVCYLPVDTAKNASEFIYIINPCLAIFVKYEFWFNYINVLYERKIPLYVISAIFRQEQYFFKPYGSWFREHLKKISFFGVQNIESKKLLEDAGIKDVQVTGDTRFDRVFSLSLNVTSNAVVKSFKGNSLLFVAGSTWPTDESVLLENIKNEPGAKYVIAPHEVDKKHIEGILNLFGKGAITYSEAIANPGLIANSNVLIIDNIGMLSSLYEYADITYIGGGFGAGIHNILEPAAFGKPIIIGPGYDKFKEARDLISQGSVFSISNATEFIMISTQLIKDKAFRLTKGLNNKDYVRLNVGATEKILAYIKANIAA